MAILMTSTQVPPRDVIQQYELEVTPFIAIALARNNPNNGSSRVW
jgi:hypothetical protein